MEHLEQHLPHSECTEEHGILLILKKFPALSHKAPIFVPASSSHCPSVFLTKLLFICPFSSDRSAHLYLWPLSCYLSAYLALISCSLPVSIPPRPLHPHPPSRFGYLLALPGVSVRMPNHFHLPRGGAFEGNSSPRFLYPTLHFKILPPSLLDMSRPHAPAWTSVEMSQAITNFSQNKTHACLVHSAL